MLENLDYLLRCLGSAGLTVKMEKAVFAVQEIDVFGFRLSKDGQRPDPEKVSAIREATRPRNVRGVRSFLGMCGYYRKFIKDFSKIAAPLIALTKSGTRWLWQPQQEAAFQQLKTLLTSAPVLALPTPDGEFQLCTDASQHALGAVLSQRQQGVMKPIAYASKLLHGPELRYSVTDKEALAAVWAVQRFRHYLDSSPFTLITDHKALLSLQKAKADSKLVRWGLILQSYNYKVKHIPGSQNAVADFLSRPDQEQTADQGTNNARCDSNPEDRDVTLQSLPATVADGHVGKTVGRPGSLPLQPPTCSSGGKNRAPFPISADLGDSSRGKRVVRDTPPVEALQGRTPFCLLTQTSESTKAPPSQVETKHQTPDLARLQAEDNEIGPLITFLTEGKLPPNKTRKEMRRKCRRFSMLNSVLVKESKGEIRTAVPRSLRRSVVENNHDNVAAGHFGVKRTLHRVQRQYFWPGMHKDISNYVRGCTICQQYKPSQKPPAGLMQKRPICGVWETCHTDICGPFPVSRKGNAYLVIFQDQYSKAIELAPLKRATSKAIARAFLDLVYARHGAPRFLSSDNGAAFCSQLLADVCTLLGVQQRHTITYRPQANPSERSLKDVVRLIACYARGHHDKWDECISLIALANNCAVQFSTKHSPYEILYGRQIRLPALPDEHLRGVPPDPEDYVTITRQALQTTHRAIAENVRRAQERQKQAYDQHRRTLELEVGDYVWLDSHPQSSAASGFSAKLAPKRDGPFSITAKRPGDIYVIKNLRTGKETRAHVDQLTISYSNKDVLCDADTSGDDGNSTSNECLECCAVPCSNPEGTDWIFCDLCDKPFHTDCIGVSLQRAAEMDFFCVFCRKEVKQGH